ncbi:MAG: BatD family protein [Saprospiraceae bacterium]
MKKELLTIALVICSIFMLSGQEAKFTAKVNMDSVLLGNAIEVTFKVENLSNAKIEAPAFEGFNVVSGPSYSTSMQVINGDMTQSASNTYWLEPKDVGQFYIMPAQVESGNTLLETQPIEINVYHNPDGIVQTPKKEKIADDFWFQWPDRSAKPEPKKKTKKKRKTYRL